MEKSILRVDGMACEHCVKAIQNAVGALPGVAVVEVNLSEKTVTVEHDGALLHDKIKDEIENQGYDVIG